MKIKMKFNLVVLYLYFASIIFTQISFAQEEQQAMTRQLVYNAYDFRDPFESYLPKDTVQELSQEERELMEQEAEKQAKPLPAFNIQGIIWKGKLKQAIINNRVLKIGDEIEGAKIVAIEKQGITFLYDKQEHQVPAPAYSSYGNLIK